ncbi:DUF6993 domain-containing protein [Pseudarthrobacter sp. S9]|uniref:DUF6993 domain-containing protein n=1 Tax=Pseudarthrobacter sp. S9 TaxID=3418421 RepID=UPI003D00A0BE
MGAAACSAHPDPALPGSTGAAPGPPAAASPSSTSPARAEETPAGSATAVAPDARQKVQAALEAVARSSPQPSREQVQAALSAAGFDAATVEVSASRTPTGLSVEAVEAGVLSGGQCVMAQIRSGNLELSLLPVLSNERCFIGNIDR